MLRRRLASAPARRRSADCELARCASAGEPRALLELFTSQGCSSCPAGRQAARRARRRSFARRAQRADRLLGLSRLEGHACQLRRIRRGSAPMRACAATGRSTRRKSSSTARCMCSAAIAPRSSARSRRPIATPRSCRCRFYCRSSGSNLNVNDAGRRGRACRRRSLALPAGESRAGRDRPRRKSRAHDHLPQCRAALAQARRFRRHGVGWNVPLSDSRARRRCRRRDGAGRHARKTGHRPGRGVRADRPANQPSSLAFKSDY